MTAVFAVFITLTAIQYKMLGVGMAFAIIIDATVVRGVLLPAAMALLGDRAWKLPGWLRWIPGRSADDAGGSAELPATHSPRTWAVHRGTQRTVPRRREV